MRGLYYAKNRIIKRAGLRMGMVVFSVTVFGYVLSSVQLPKLWQANLGYLVGLLIVWLIGEVVNLAAFKRHRYEAIAFNEKRDGLLLRSGLWQQRVILLPLEAVAVSVDGDKMRLAYAQAAILGPRGTILGVEPGVIHWSTQEFPPGMLSIFGNQVQIAQRELKRTRPMIIAANPKVKSRATDYRELIIVAASVLLVAGVLAAVPAVNVTKPVVKEQVKGNTKTTDKAKTKTVTKALSPVVINNPNFQSIVYKPGVTVSTNGYHFQINRGYLAWNTNNERVVIFNITVGDRQNTTLSPTMEASSSFYTLSQFSLVPVKKTDPYSQGNDLGHIDWAPIKHNGKNVEIVNAFADDFYFPADYPLSEKITMNVPVQIPKKGKTFDFYYHGFLASQRDAPDTSYEDSSFVMRVDKALLEEIHE
jgi:hypothetical protein